VIKQHRRLISSAYIYTRLHTKIPELEDKFLYLCIAVESATRFGEGMRSHNSTQFAKFFVNNLSLGSKVLIARKFRDNWTKEHYERFSIYHISPKSTESIQQTKECSKVSRTALLPRCYDEDKCYIELDHCYEGYCKYLKGDYTTEDMKVSMRLCTMHSATSTRKGITSYTKVSSSVLLHPQASKHIPQYREYLMCIIKMGSHG